MRAGISWNAIVDALTGDHYSENDPAAAHLSLYGLPSIGDPDVANLHASTVFLSLQMISDGIAIDSFTLLKIKNYLVEIIGFHDVSVVPSYNGQSFQVQFGEVSEIANIALPCINQLLSVMDASHSVDVAPSAMAGADNDERPVHILVGSVFVDVFLSMICTVKDLTLLPIMTCKNMLETLCVVIYKHDFENRVLKHLQQILRRAVMRALEYAGQDISYELRQLGLSTVHATAIESIAKLATSQSQFHGQDALATQARAFLDTNLAKYAQNGLFANLLKRPLTRDFFLVLKQVTDSNARSNPTAPQSLRELLLRDVFLRVIDADPVALQNVLDNTQIYVELVHHQNFTAETIQCE
ncbi:hypothetical protein H0H87_002441 [Tephrocybe sp. NHM501043]|nr:hypothetical protein H0H87_002441 [Tephrocybe sp. NHM501043]